LKATTTKEKATMIEGKRSIRPIVNVRHNEDDSGFMLDVYIAWATKESVEPDMGNTGFCIKADGMDLEYESYFMMAHEVKPDEAMANFDSGLLKIKVLFKTLWGDKE